LKSTKLILVDGIVGSGKSSISHFISRQLNKNGIKVKWYHEGSIENPIICTGKDVESAGIDESSPDFGQWATNFYLQRWKEFISKIENGDNIYVLDSCLFQRFFMPMIWYDLEPSKVKEIMHNLLYSMKSLNPQIIHFYQPDVITALKKISIQRGSDWKNSVFGSDENSYYAKNRNLKGEEATFSLWQKISGLALELLNEFDCQNLLIDNSEQKWDHYRRQISEFLEIELKQEKKVNLDYSKFCGNFYGNGEYLNFHSEDNKLFVDTFWPDLLMLENSEYEFEIEGFPTYYRFIPDDDGKINSLEIIKAEHECDNYLTGSILNRLKEINEAVVEKFCGNFYCESSMVTRKIYIKNGKLFYWRGESDESLLTQIAENKLVMNVAVENQLDFKLVNGKWQFTLEVKGKEPSISLFVPKATGVEIGIYPKKWTVC